MQESPSEHSTQLRQYIGTLRTRKWTIFVVTLAVLGLALFVSFRQTPIYEASSRLQIKPAPNTGSDQSFVAFPSVVTESEVIASEPVAARVVDALNLDVTPRELLAGVTAQPTNPDISDIVIVSYRSQDPKLARDVANAVSDQYIRYRREEALETLLAQQRGIQEQIVNVRGQITNLQRRLAEATEEGDAALSARLETELTSESTRLGFLQERLDEVKPDRTAVFCCGEILEAATLPGSPSSPDHTTNGLLGLVLGAALGVGAAFVRERFEDRFRGRPDVERVLGAPVLATVPKYDGNRRGPKDLITLIDPKGAAAEAYRNLRTSLQFLSSQRGFKTILLTSASAHEGKTSTTANLALVLSQAGRRVVLVSADLRRPTLEEYFDVQAEAGLSSWLLDEERDIGNLVLGHPEMPNLYLLPSGPVPSNPAELLTSPRLPELIQSLERQFDIVLIDSPPSLPVADAVILASHVGGVLLIIDAASTSRSAAVHAKEQIERVGGNLLGAVLNAFDPAASPYYYEPYYYSQYYSRVESDEENPNPRRRASDRRAEEMDEIARRRQGSS